ncbi:uncharacterized protein LOC144235982 [Crocuta crocuta]
MFPSVAEIRLECVQESVVWPPRSRRKVPVTVPCVPRLSLECVASTSALDLLAGHFACPSITTLLLCRSAEGPWAQLKEGRCSKEKGQEEAVFVKNQGLPAPESPCVTAENRRGSPLGAEGVFCGLDRTRARELLMKGITVPEWKFPDWPCSCCVSKCL